MQNGFLGQGKRKEISMATEAEKRAGEKYRKSKKGKATKRLWKDHHRDKVRKWKREWATTPKGLESARKWKTSPRGRKSVRKWYRNNPIAMYFIYKASSKRRKISFRIGKKLFISLLSMPCHYCGLRAEDSIPKRNGLDRVNNNIGYTKNNVVTCCLNCNQMKGKRTVDEFIKHIKNIIKHQKGNKK